MNLFIFEGELCLLPGLSGKLQSGQPPLTQLMYQLGPGAETDRLLHLSTDKLCRAQAKRPGERVPGFLAREEKVHDEALKVLQKLLRDGCNVT